MSRVSNPPLMQAAPIVLGEPAWEIATLFPNQGDWSVEEYFGLNTNRLVEFSDGCIEVLPMPTMLHQDILLFLLDILRAFASSGRLGKALFAGMKVRVSDAKYREPDIVFMLAEHADRMGQEFWESADLVMEVVSESNRDHDIVKKRLEYALAGIPEYWIVDPMLGRISVLTLADGAYAVHGEFAKGERASSVLLPGFEVDVTAALAAGA